MSISISSTTPYWLTATVARTAKEEVAAPVQKNAVEGAVANTSNTSHSGTAATAAKYLTGKQKEAYIGARTQEEFIAATKEYWNAPITEADRQKILANNEVLDTQSFLDLQAKRPEYTVNYSNMYSQTLLYSKYGNFSILGKAEKMEALRAFLPEGHALDSIIQGQYEVFMAQFNGYEKATPGSAYANDAKGYLIRALQDIQHMASQDSFNLDYGTLKLDDNSDLFAYTREVIFQRSSVEHGKGVDMAKLMHAFGMMSDAEYAALPVLTLPQNSEKLAAYAVKVEADKAAKAEQEAKLAAEQADMAHVPNTLLLTSDDLPGIDLGDKALKITGMDRANINLDEIIGSIVQNPDGTISSTSIKYSVQVMDTPPESALIRLNWATTKHPEGMGVAAGLMDIPSAPDVSPSPIPHPSGEEQGISYQQALDSYGFSSENTSILYTKDIVADKILVLQIKNNSPALEIHLGNLFQQMIETGQTSISTDDYTVSLLDITPQMREYLKIPATDIAQNNEAAVASAAYNKQQTALEETLNQMRLDAAENLIPDKGALLDELLA